MIADLEDQPIKLVEAVGSLLYQAKQQGRNRIASSWICATPLLKARFDVAPLRVSRPQPVARDPVLASVTESMQDNAIR